jgi:hypothetical protein
MNIKRSLVSLAAFSLLSLTACSSIPSDPPMPSGQLFRINPIDTEAKQQSKPSKTQAYTNVEAPIIFENTEKPMRYLR